VVSSFRTLVKVKESELSPPYSPPTLLQLVSGYVASATALIVENSYRGSEQQDRWTPRPLVAWQLCVTDDFVPYLLPFTSAPQFLLPSLFCYSLTSICAVVIFSSVLFSPVL
jgi:hypothetical protein